MEYLSFHGYAGAGARLVTLAELEVQTLNLGLGELHGQPNKKPSILDGKNYRRNGGWLWKWPQTYCCFTWLYILHTTWKPPLPVGVQCFYTNAVCGDTVPKAVVWHLFLWETLSGATFWSGRLFFIWDSPAMSHWRVLGYHWWWLNKGLFQSIVESRSSRRIAWNDSGVLSIPVSANDPVPGLESRMISPKKKPLESPCFCGIIRPIFTYKQQNHILKIKLSRPSQVFSKWCQVSSLASLTMRLFSVERMVVCLEGTQKKLMVNHGEAPYLITIFPLKWP